MSAELNKANFRIALTSSGLTQKQFAQRCNVSQPLISMILADRRHPSKQLKDIMKSFIATQFEKLRFIPITKERMSNAA